MSVSRTSEFMPWRCQSTVSRYYVKREQYVVRGGRSLTEVVLVGRHAAAQRGSRPVHSNKLAGAAQIIRTPTKDRFACSRSLCRSSYSSLSRINKQPVPE